MIGCAIGIIVIEVDDGDIIPVVDMFIFWYTGVEDGDHAL